MFVLVCFSTGLMALDFKAPYANFGAYETHLAAKICASPGKMSLEAPELFG